MSALLVCLIRNYYFSIYKNAPSLQESVCATFGAGVSYACVVDVGDQKTTVSCVEDGISHRKTR